MYLKTIPFGTDLLFRCQELCVGVEICEDVWMPIPPSSYQAIAGANILLNLSASNETVAKAEYRQELIRNQSARCMAAYAYSSAGSDESTSDLVFGQGKVLIGGVPFQVGANIVDLGTGQGQATVNITAVKSKTWEPGEAAPPPPAKPAAATAALAAPVVPAGPRSMTRQDATDAFAQALGIPVDQLMEQAGLTKSLNKWAKASGIVIV
jgi:hypothetical protein